MSHWAGYEPITAEIQRYAASPWSGFDHGRLVGVVLTDLVLVGAVIVLLPRFQPAGLSRGQAWGVVVWLLTTAALLMLSPLAWQRYYLPIISPAILLAGIALATVFRLARRHAGRLRRVLRRAAPAP